MHSYPLNNNPSPARPEPGTKIEHELIEHLDDALASNLLARDTETLQQLLGRAFVLRLPTGKVLRKSELVDLMATGELQYRFFRRENRSVRFSGINIAFLTGSCTLELQFMGKSTRGEFRYTTLYVRNNDPWQAVAMFQYDGIRLV